MFLISVYLWFGPLPVYLRLAAGIVGGWYLITKPSEEYVLASSHLAKFLFVQRMLGLFV